MGNNGLYCMQCTQILNHVNTNSWNPSSSKTRTCLFYIVSIMGADVLATQGARTSATMMFTVLNQINSVPGLTRVNTLRLLQMSTILLTILFSFMEIILFLSKFPWHFFSKDPVNNDLSLDQINGLVLNGCQAIIWINDGLFYWCINV